MAWEADAGLTLLPSVGRVKGRLHKSRSADKERDLHRLAKRRAEAPLKQEEEESL